MSLSESEIEQLVALGKTAHPTIGEPAGLRALLEERAAELKPRELEVRAADFYLVAACSAGDDVAIGELSVSLPAIVRPALGKLGVPPSDDDEIIQRTRIALLAPDEHGARGLAGYAGRADLRSYVRAVAIRIALKRIQRETTTGDDDASEIMMLIPDANDSAELQLLKKKYAAELRAAFAAGLAALSPRERALMWQRYIDGLTIDLLAPLHRVHRSTCARWLEAAHVKVLREVRKYLRGVLGFDDRELECAVDLVKSQLDLSLRRNLAGTSG